uniref:MULE transposase domain-containing protein n=1 Tax=Lactuca sativa TaxID=4236 RepID=A0A9R1XP37_LACSA|nr:hypothetical protein LSAT_V11C200098750 [Lactuca sativa]
MSFSERQHEESFNNLPIYLHNLRRTNLHNYTHIITDLMDLFEACFVVDNAFTSKLIRVCSQKIQLHAFISCFLPVIIIGSVPFRGDYLKTIFVAVAIKGNNHTLPVTFGLVVENNIYCGTWFLMRLREALIQGREVLFIKNMDDVVSSCIEHVFPDSYHVCTSKSVFKCMRTRGVSDRTLQPLFWMTSNSYIVSDFEGNFRRLTLMLVKCFPTLFMRNRQGPISLTFVIMYSTLMFPVFYVIGKSTQYIYNSLLRQFMTTFNGLSMNAD